MQWLSYGMYYFMDFSVGVISSVIWLIPEFLNIAF